MKKILLLCLLCMLIPAACAVTYDDVVAGLGVYTYADNPLCASETTAEIDGMQYFCSEPADANFLCYPSAGILSDVRADLNGDGAEELLVVYTRPSPDDVDSKTVCMRAYTGGDGDLTLLDDAPLFDIHLDSFTVRLIEQDGRAKILTALHPVIFSGDGEDYVSAALYSFDDRFRADWVTFSENTGLYLLAGNIDDHDLVRTLHTRRFDAALLEPYAHTLTDFDPDRASGKNYFPETHRRFRQSMQALGLECVLLDPDGCPFFEELIGGQMIVSHSQFYKTEQYRTGAAAKALAAQTPARLPVPIAALDLHRLPDACGEFALRAVPAEEFSAFTEDELRFIRLCILNANYSPEPAETDPDSFSHCKYSNTEFSYSWLNSFEKQNIETIESLLNR